MKTSKVPNSVCWNITNICNDNCSFCYRDQEGQVLSQAENMKILKNIIAAGVKKITFAGGEPLLYPGISPLMRYAKNAGMCTSLTTNGRFLTDERLEEIAYHLDWLTLSLDAPNKELQAKMTRAEDHFQVVDDIMHRVQSRQYPFRLKINTVVSKVNQAAIIHMLPLMVQYHVERWKLFQFIPLRGNATQNSKIFNMTDQAFAAVVRQVTDQQTLGQYPVNISVTDRNDLESAYFTVFPNGEVRISTGMKDVTLGNLLTDDTAAIWQNNAFAFDLHEVRTGQMLLSSATK